MGVIEDLSSKVDLMTQELTCIHNRIDELNDSSVSAHKRISKIEERLAPTCVKATVTYGDPEGVKQRQNEESRKQPDQCQHDWTATLTDTPASLWANMKCEKCGCTQSSAIGGKFQHQNQLWLNVDGRPVRVVGVNSYPSPVPGTWAWACEQMLAGKTVSRIGKSTGIKWHMKIDGSSVYCRATDDCMWQRGMVDKADLTATDWQVVS